MLSLTDYWKLLFSSFPYRNESIFKGVIALNQIPKIFRLSRVLVESLICEVDVAHSFSGKDTNLCIK